MIESAISTAQAPPSNKGNELSILLIALLKGVLYQENDAQLFAALVRLQSRVRDYVNVLGLEMVLDESEGYAFLKVHTADDVEGSEQLPRLIARHPLSFPVSLLLALLRKKLAEFDARGGETRLVLSRDEIVDLLKVFLPEHNNETKVIRQVDAHINKIVELGFLRKLKTQSAREDSFEVKRILKSFVDAQWLAEFDARLAQYRARLIGNDVDD